jgi:hypothetical protein
MSTTIIEQQIETYKSLHKWIRKNKPIPIDNKCEKCKTEPLRHVANISKETNVVERYDLRDPAILVTYNRDFDNWWWACIPCHEAHDGRLGRHIADKEGRRCFDCGSDKTHRLLDGNRKTSYPQWYHFPWDQMNWYCDICHNRLIRQVRKEVIKNV